MRQSGKSNEQRSMEAAVFRSRVLACLTKNGYQSNAQLCARLGCTNQELRTKISIMMREDLAHSVCTPDRKFSRSVLYGAGPGENSANKEIKQKVTAKWKSLPVQIDPILAVLFGQAKQHNGDTHELTSP